MDIEDILIHKFNNLADDLRQVHEHQMAYVPDFIGIDFKKIEETIHKEIHKTLRQIKKIRRGK